MPKLNVMLFETKTDTYQKTNDMLYRKGNQSLGAENKQLNHNGTTFVIKTAYLDCYSPRARRESCQNTNILMMAVNNHQQLYDCRKLLTEINGYSNEHFVVCLAVKESEEFDRAWVKDEMLRGGIQRMQIHLLTCDFDQSSDLLLNALANDWQTAAAMLPIASDLHQEEKKADVVQQHQAVESASSDVSRAGGGLARDLFATISARFTRHEATVDASNPCSSYAIAAPSVTRLTHDAGASRRYQAIYEQRYFLEKELELSL